MLRDTLFDSIFSNMAAQEIFSRGISYYKKEMNTEITFTRLEKHLFRFLANCQGDLLKLTYSLCSKVIFWVLACYIFVTLHKDF